MKKGARAQGGDEPGPSTSGGPDTGETEDPATGRAEASPDRGRFAAADAARGVAGANRATARSGEGLDVFCTLLTNDRRSIDLPWFEHHLGMAMAHLGRPIGRVSVSIVDDRRMTDLHERFSGLRETTDVLTFPREALAAGTEGEIDADIAVCLDEARRQAAERGHAPERELLLYAVHGLLHCCGFDDHDDRSWSALHAEEDRILEAIGVGPTFSAGGSGSAGRAADRAPRSREERAS